MSGPTWTIFMKEVIDNLRDRRSLMTAAMFAFIGPLVLVPMLNLIGHVSGTDVVRVPVQGADLAPGLVEYLRARDIEASAPPADPSAAVRDLAADVVIVIPPSYPTDFREGRPATVRVVADESRTQTAGTVRRVERAIEAYAETVGTLRLVARGVSPSAVTPIAVAIDDVATPESKGAAILAVVPIMLFIALFSGGIHIAVDVTAGERERGSLEPLMSTPASAAQIVLGKLGAVMVFALGTVLLADVAFALTISFAPYPEVPGMKFALGARGALEIAAIMTPLLLPVAALQMLLASRSRTVKEAFTSVSIASLLPPFCGMFLAFSAYKPTLAAMTIPLFAQNLLVNEVFRGGGIQPAHALVAAVTTFASGVVLSGVAVAYCANVRMLSGR